MLSIKTLTVITVISMIAIIIIFRFIIDTCVGDYDEYSLIGEDFYETRRERKERNKRRQELIKKVSEMEKRKRDLND